MSARLVITQGRNRGAEFFLQDRIIFDIGSDQGSSIFVDDPEVSPNHCRLYKEEGRFTLFDVSGRGLYVNGKKVVKAELNHGDAISIGRSELQFTGGPPMQSRPANPGAYAGQEGEVERAWLTVVEGNDKGKEFDLSREECYVLGRGHSADVTVMDIKVSRAHCRVDREGNDFFLTDLNSTNGTFRNGKRIDRVKLEHGDYVKVGYSILKFQVKRAQVQAAAPPPAGGGDFFGGPPAAGGGFDPWDQMAGAGSDAAASGGGGDLFGGGFGGSGGGQDPFGGDDLFGAPAAPAAAGGGDLFGAGFGNPFAQPPSGQAAPPSPPVQGGGGFGGDPFGFGGGDPFGGNTQEATDPFSAGFDQPLGDSGFEDFSGSFGGDDMGLTPGGAPSEADDLDALFDDAWEMSASPPPAEAPVRAGPAPGQGGKQSFNTIDLVVPEMLSDDDLFGEGLGAPGAGDPYELIFDGDGSGGGGQPVASRQFDSPDVGGSDLDAMGLDPFGDPGGGQSGLDFDLRLEDSASAPPEDDPWNFSFDMDLEGGEDPMGGSGAAVASGPPALASRPPDFQTGEVELSRILVRPEDRTYRCYMCHKAFPAEQVEEGALKEIKGNYYCTSCISGT